MQAAQRRRCTKYAPDVQNFKRSSLSLQTKKYIAEFKCFLGASDDEPTTSVLNRESVGAALAAKAIMHRMHRPIAAEAAPTRSTGYRTTGAPLSQNGQAPKNVAEVLHEKKKVRTTLIYWRLQPMTEKSGTALLDVAAGTRP